MTNKGCELTDTTNQDIHWMINDADAVVAVMGLSPLLEGENGDASLSTAGGDKKDISFPYAQLKYLRALRAKTNKPLIVIITSGSAIELGEVEQLADAVVLAWYPGEQGGNAVADILFGKANPSGKLPVTFYQSNNDLPPFEDYSMKNRTYRYFKGLPLHPFGYGLSYTKFGYFNLAVTAVANGYRVSCDLLNNGNMDGDEVVQLYIRHVNAGEQEAIKQLKNFKRITLLKGAPATKVDFSISMEDFQYWDDEKNGWTVYPGDYEILVGSSSTDLKLIKTITIK
jgi:beta-glucosidase